MEEFEVVFYRRPNGTTPMDEFLESLPPPEAEREGAP